MPGRNPRLDSFLRGVLRIQPKNFTLYELALSHSSLRTVMPGALSNERLEFLGDAVIELVVTEYLYERFSSLPEGTLSWIRSRVVCRENLNRIADDLGLSSLLVAAPGVIEKSQNILGDTLEALLGALYLDQGFEGAAKAFRRLILDASIDWNELLEHPVDYKSRLLHWAQSIRADLRIVTHSLGGDSRRFAATVRLDGYEATSAMGASKKHAEREAARLFIEQNHIPY